MSRRREKTALAMSSPSDDKPRAKRLRVQGPSREAWLADVFQATTLTREQSARELDERATAIAKDRRRVWASRAPELADVRHDPPGLVARDGRTGRVFNTGDAVRFDELEAGRSRVVWDPRRKIHQFVKGVEVEEHTEHRGGVPEFESRWHTSRARNKRELEKRVADCGKAEGARVRVVCRDCKHTTDIEVGCGSQWFCPSCRTRSVMRIQKRFLRNRHGLLVQAARAGLTKEDDAEREERDRHWGRARAPRRPPLGGFWGERFLTLTLPARGGPVERLEVINATWSRFWRTLLDELRPQLSAPSGIRGEHIARGVSESKAENAIRVMRSYRAARTHRKDAPALDRHDAIPTGDYELPLSDVFSYFRVLEWTPGADGQGHPHVHAWLFSQYLDQRRLEELWQAAWIHVQRARLHGLEEPKHGPIEEKKTIVDIRAATKGVEKELVKYLTKDWEVEDGQAKRANPEVFAQVYAALDGKRRRQSNSGFSIWATEHLNECPCCGFERERGHWARVDIDHTLDHVTERLGSSPRIGHYLHWDPDDPDNPLNGTYQPMPEIGAGEAQLRAEHQRKGDRSWQGEDLRAVIAARMAPVLGVSRAWTLQSDAERAPLDFEQIRFVCEGEPEPSELDPDQLDIFEGE